MNNQVAKKHQKVPAHGKKNGGRGNGKKNVSVPKVGSVSVPAIRSAGDLHALRGNYGLIPESSIAVVEYKKMSTTVFAILLNDVGLRSEKKMKSYDFLWKVPGFSINADDVKTDGLACHLSHTVYHIRNICDFAISIRMQRPLGFRADPCALAMWEPIAHSQDLIITVSPRQTIQFNVSNGATSMMCPRHVTHGGNDFIHLMSLSPFREASNVHGNDPVVDGKRAGIAVEIEAQTHYRVNDGKIGKSSDYCVFTYDDATHMDFISPGPVQPLRLVDILDDPGVNHFCVIKENNYLKFVGIDGSNKKITAFDRLDITANYRLPAGVVVSKILGDEQLDEFCKIGMKYPNVYESYVGALPDILYYSAFNKAWYVGALLTDSTGDGVGKTRLSKQFNTTNVYDFPVFSPLEYIRPVNTGLAKSLVGYKTKTVRATAFPVGPRHVLGAYQSNWIETTLTAMITIVEVLSTVSQFAAAFSLLRLENQTIGADDSDDLNKSD